MSELNQFSPSPGIGRKRKRVGRGIGCGNGKTCGRGHKGQKSRAGGYHKIGFEGGQMPLVRRLPKFGFRSRMSASRAEIVIGRLEKYADTIITPDFLKENNEVSKKVTSIKLIATGTLTKPITVEGLKVSKGAKLAIEGVGGTIK